MLADGFARRLARTRFLRSLRSVQPHVLAYHRVGRVAADPQLLCVTPEHFAEHLEVIARNLTPLPLGDLVAAAREGRLPRRGIAITLDDGYADNLVSAKPLLEQRGVAATVFVTSGYVGHGRRFWWDELERLLLRPGRLPDSVRVEVAGETVRCALGDDALYTPNRASERRRWTILDREDPGPRQELYRLLCGLLRTLAEPERERVLAGLRAVADLDQGCDGELGRPLSPDELRRLVEGDLVEAGAHTVTHPILSRLSAARQRGEIAGSKRQLEETLGRRVYSFAYPYGTPAEVSETTVSIVRAAGFQQACMNTSGWVGRRTDPFRIPRLLVRNWSGDDLARRLWRIHA